MVGLVWSNDPEKEGYPGPPSWGLKCEANNLTSIKKILLLRSLIMDASWITEVKDQGKAKKTITFLPQHFLGLDDTLFAN
jgi:hypothetical protein